MSNSNRRSSFEFAAGDSIGLWASSTTNEHTQISCWALSSAQCYELLLLLLLWMNCVTSNAIRRSSSKNRFNLSPSVQQQRRSFCKTAHFCVDSSLHQRGIAAVWVEKAAIDLKLQAMTLTFFPFFFQMSDKIVELNVGGTPYTTKWSTLMKTENGSTVLRQLLEEDAKDSQVSVWPFVRPLANVWLL